MRGIWWVITANARLEIAQMPRAKGSSTPLKEKVDAAASWRETNEGQRRQNYFSAKRRLKVTAKTPTSAVEMIAQPADRSVKATGADFTSFATQ